MTLLAKITRRVSRLVLKITGWKLIGENFVLQKSVVVAFPHSGASDLYYTLLAAYALGLQTKIVVKEELFVFGIRWLLKHLGCIPVKRNSRTNTTAFLAEMFDEKNTDLHLIIAATGTRNKEAPWKTGFLSVARMAKVPILLATINRDKKVCGIFSVYFPTKNSARDLTIIKTRYGL